MASISPGLISSLLATLSLLLSNSSYAQAKEYTVGDDGRWDQGVNYLRWSQKYNFTVGDVLVFNYVEGQHNVYQVTEDTYRSCDSTSGVNAIYVTGHDRVLLTEAAAYWFICNTRGHCKGGMRFGIKVQNAGSERAPPAPPAPPVGSEAGRWRPGWVWGVVCLISAFI